MTQTDEYAITSPGYYDMLVLQQCCTEGRLYRTYEGSQFTKFALRLQARIQHYHATK